VIWDVGSYAWVNTSLGLDLLDGRCLDKDLHAVKRLQLERSLEDGVR